MGLGGVFRGGVLSRVKVRKNIAYVSCLVMLHCFLSIAFFSTEAVVSANDAICNEFFRMISNLEKFLERR